MYPFHDLETACSAIHRLDLFMFVPSTVFTLNAGLRRQPCP